MSDNAEVIVLLVFFTLIAVWFIFGYLNDSKKIQKLTFFDQIPFFLFSILSLVFFTLSIFLIARLEQSFLTILIEIVFITASVLCIIPAYWLSKVIKASKQISITRIGKGNLIFKLNSNTTILSKDTISKIEFFYPLFKSPLPSFTVFHLKMGRIIYVNSLVCDPSIIDSELGDVTKVEREYYFKEYEELLEKSKKN